MKTPAAGMDVTRIERQEPKVYIGFYPTRPDQTGEIHPDPMNAAPSILIMPVGGDARLNELKYGDIRKGTARPPELGQTLRTQVLFSVYEDGVRMPGFIEQARGGDWDISLVREGSDEGLFLLLDWVDDFREKLLAARVIPGTDMALEDDQLTWAMYADQHFISDRRPLYYAYLNVIFRMHSDEAQNRAFRELLD